MYGSRDFELDDRLLAHLKVVIGQKLKKNESFYLNWAKPASEGGGRTSLWISPASELGFHFAGSRAFDINAHWVAVMIALSHGTRGVVVTTEAEAEALAKNNPDLV